MIKKFFIVFFFLSICFFLQLSAELGYMSWARGEVAAWLPHASGLGLWEVRDMSPTPSSL